MFRSPSRLTIWTLGLACAAVGCSNSRMAQHSPSRLPDQQSISVPGTSDVVQNGELRHPEKVHVAYGRWQEQQRQFPEARDSYQRALNSDPKSVEALLGLARLDRLAGRTADAEKHLMRAEKLRPNDPLIAAAWGEHYTAGSRWPEAIAKYRVAVSQAPLESLYKHQLAVALTRSGAIQEGHAAFAEIVGRAEAHYNVGFILQQQGKLLEAEEQFQRALALKPGMAPATKMLARVREERGVPTQVAERTSSAPLPSTTPTPSPVTPASATRTPDKDVQTAVWQPRSEPESHPIADDFGLSGAPSELTPQQLEQRRNQQALQNQP